MAEAGKSVATVIGGGGWGTALAVHLAGKGHDTCIWVRETDVAEGMRNGGENARFLPGVRIPAKLSVTSDIAEACARRSDFIVMAVPTHAMRAVISSMGPIPGGSVVVSVAKGFEVETCRRPSEVIAEAGGVQPGNICVLSGPSHAEEVGRNIPTAVVAASTDPAVAKRVQDAFFAPRFRIYTHSDPLGVELGGALKNVIAVACGVGDGLEFGDNTRAALMTRGLAEMTRLGVAMGARRDSLWGLAGLGDLIVTCGSDLSRNRQLGRRIGRGEKLADIQAGMTQVAEGVRACQGAMKLARERSVTMPITSQVHAMLFEGKPPVEALESLLSREMRSEEEGGAGK